MLGISALDGFRKAARCRRLFLKGPGLLQHSTSVGADGFRLCEELLGLRVFSGGSDRLE